MLNIDLGRLFFQTKQVAEYLTKKTEFLSEALDAEEIAYIQMLKSSDMIMELSVVA